MSQHRRIRIYRFYGFKKKARKKLSVLCSVDLYEEIGVAATTANAKMSQRFCTC